MKKFYYISQGETPKAHLQNIENVCKLGVPMIQLRLKGETDEVVLKTALKAKEICKQYNAKLFINDYAFIAEEVQTDGVHLGQNDECPLIARNRFQIPMLIGGTANTLKECLELCEKKVDYIGLGPFRFTETKKKLSPILGLEGYQNIISSMKAKGFNVPVYAIGGIIDSDFDALYQVGVHGIAMSGYLTKLASNYTDK